MSADAGPLVNAAAVPSFSREASPTTRSARPSSTPRPKPPALSLRASPAQVSPGQRITLTGDFRGHDGARLQVQRFESGWVDFPVQATVTGGSFSTYIITSRSGVNRLRVTDPASGRASPAVRVTVR